MNDNNFQEGVGKKIVEALKYGGDDEMAGQSVEQRTFGAEQAFGYNQQPDYSSEQFIQPSMSENTFGSSFDTASFASADVNNQNYANFQPASPFTEEIVASSDTVGMPPNVAVLRRLISQLPNGVTKQTGAQIIRQTMEALGISMNSVLHEAQQVQDGLNDSVKTCMYSIQEYKNNIKSLEKQVLDYQKQIAYLNDLISLFVMTDKTR